MKTGYKAQTMIVLGGLLLQSLCTIPLHAQSDSTGTAPSEIPNKAKGGGTKFLLAGKAQQSWTNTKVDGSPNSHTFYPDALMLMPLVKLNDRLFLDAQIEVDPNTTGGAAINLNEMIVYFRATNCLNIFAGDFSPKYGMYMGVLDDFTNRYATNPIGMNRGPGTQTGIGVQGGIQAGTTKLNYQFYLANGPQLLVDSTTQGNSNPTGQLSYGNYADNNNNKAIGGSIGFLPLSNSNLQIDISGQVAAKTGNLGTMYENVSSTSWAADLNYYHLFNPLMVRVQAEYNSTVTQNKTYPWKSTADSTKSLVPAFNNQLSGWFVGATLRLAGVKSVILSNFELGARVGGYTPPQYTGLGTTPAVWGENPEQQTTICLTYWFTWKTPLNFAYDVLKTTGGPTITTYTARLIYFF